MGRAKNLGAIQEQQMKDRIRYKENEKFAGAIKRDKYVMALKRDNKTWKLAQILEIRYAQPFDSDEEPESSDTEMMDTKKEENENNTNTKQDGQDVKMSEEEPAAVKD